VLVVRAVGRFDTLVEDGPGLLRSVILRQGLRVHLIAGYVIWVIFVERCEVNFRGRDITFLNAGQCQAVPGESVLRMRRHKFFEFLPARFGRFGHVLEIVYGRAKD
jgi:hypothetical protein